MPYMKLNTRNADLRPFVVFSSRRDQVTQFAVTGSTFDQFSSIICKFPTFLQQLQKVYIEGLQSGKQFK